MGIDVGMACEMQVIFSFEMGMWRTLVIECIQFVKIH